MKTRRIPRNRFGPPSGPPQGPVDARPRLALPVVPLIPAQSSVALHALRATELASIMGLTVICIRSSGANIDDAGTRPHRPLTVNPASGVGDDVALTVPDQRGVDEA